MALACIGVIAALVLAGYFIGLPIAARHIAARVPIETERALGQETLAWFDAQQWFLASDVDPERQQRLRDGFAALIRSEREKWIPLFRKIGIQPQ